MQYLKHLSLILIILSILFCLMGAASAAEVIKKVDGEDNTFIITLDPVNMPDYEGVSSDGDFYKAGYSEDSFNSIEVSYNLSPSPDAAFDVYTWTNSSSPLNLSINLINGFDTNSDVSIHIHNGNENWPNIIFDGGKHEIKNGSFKVDGISGFENFSIINLNLLNGSLDISKIHENTYESNTAAFSIKDSKINGDFILSNVGHYNDSNPNSNVSGVTVDNVILTSGQMVFDNIYANNISIKNSNFQNITSYSLMNLGNNINANSLEIQNSSLKFGTATIIPKDIGSISLSDNLTMDNSDLIFDLMYAGDDTSISLSGLNVSEGNIYFESALPSHSYDFSLTDSYIKNGTLDFKSCYNFLVSVSNNNISNYGPVLHFENVTSVAGSRIFNNIFMNDGSYYIGIPVSGSNSFDLEFNASHLHQDGLNVMGGPWIAGNYWGTFANNGHSDLLPEDETGYSTVSYEISRFDSLNPGELVDNFPLTKFTVPNDGGGTTGPVLPVIPPAELEPIQTPPGNPDDPSDPDDPTSETPGPGTEPPSGSYSAGSGSGTNQILTELKNDGLTTEEVVTGYVAPASVVIGATAGSVLLIISGFIDLFFDVTSGQVRGLAKGKINLKFSPPRLSQIFSARTAYMVLFFVFGIGVIDTLLGDAVEASMNGGLLTPFAAYISPLLLSTTVNIGGGLFFDEVLEFIFKRIGKYVNQTTGILDLINFGGTANAIVFVCLIGLTGGLLAFCVYFLEWTLI